MGLLLTVAAVCKPGSALVVTKLHDQTLYQSLQAISRQAAAAAAAAGKG
jgi:hypothetical protein